jgi:alanine racemase
MLGRTYKVINEITLDAAAYRHNYAYYVDQAKLPIAPVLKANAYGHGLIPMSQLADTLHAPFLCVDSLYEAYELQKAHRKTPILILGYTFPENYHTFRSLSFSFAVSDFDSLAALAKYQPRAKIHLKLDTGMCRLGFLPNQLSILIKTIKRYPHLRIEGFFSHFSQADNLAKKPFTKQQVNLFKHMVGTLESADIHCSYKHIAATAGSSWASDPYFSFCRVGLGLYGYTPFPTNTTLGKKEHQQLHPVLEFVSHIVSLKTVDPSSEVSYGGTYTTTRKETLAVLGAGYAEGINRALSNQGVVTINHRECPIVGNVCMDMTVVKIPKDHRVRIGNQAIIINRDLHATNNLYRISQLLHTIPYTVLTGLHPSIRRTIISSH